MATSAGTRRPATTRLGIVVTVFLLATPLAVAAQQASEKIPLIGALDYSAPDSARLNWWQSLRQALQELGYVEGRSIRFEARWAHGRRERLPGLAAELVRLRVDVLVTGGSESAQAAKKATATIPIVMATGADPVRLGLVESLGRPGGNVTGVTSLSTELIIKRVELLRDLLPKISRVAVLSDGTPNTLMSVREVEATARSLGIATHPIGVAGPNDLDRAFSPAAKEHALIVIASPPLFTERKRIADLALKHRLPSVVGGREYAEAGGLLSYAVSYPDLFRRAALYVDRILKGAKPVDLPVEQPTTFELVINLKTAKMLSLTIPQSLLVRANALIE
ncbi:MAG: ABC transporter substrate-binding protein [Rhodospirillales bacterium]|nr:ABC transporter substrate-binding protein [Rhodospirillales bacterium]